MALLLYKWGGQWLRRAAYGNGWALSADCCCSVDQTCCGCECLEQYYFEGTTDPSTHRIKVSFVSGPITGDAILGLVTIIDENWCYQWSSDASYGDLSNLSPADYVRTLDFQCADKNSVAPGDTSVNITLGGALCGITFNLVSFDCDSTGLDAIYEGTLDDGGSGDCAPYNGQTVRIRVTNFDPWPEC